MPSLEEQIRNNPYYRGLRLGVIEPRERSEEEMKQGTVFGIRPTPAGVLESMANLFGKLGAEKIGEKIAEMNTSSVPDIFGNIPSKALETAAVKPTVTTPTITPTVTPATTPKMNVTPETVTKEVIPQTTIPTKINATPKASERGYGVEGVITGTTPLTIKGNTFTSINPNKATEEVLAQQVIAQPKEEKKNPYDMKFDETLQELKDTLSKTPTDMYDIVAKKYKVAGLSNVLKDLMPLTSQGHYGVETMKNLVEQGKLGIQQAKLAPEIEETKAKTGLYQAGGVKALAEAEEAKGKGKFYSESAPKAEPFALQAQKAWLTGLQNYLKSDIVLQDIMDKPPEEREKAVETQIALYKKLFKPPETDRIKNPDGTVTVIYADGTTQKFKKKEGK